MHDPQPDHHETPAQDAVSDEALHRTRTGDPFLTMDGGAPCSVTSGPSESPSATPEEALEDPDRPTERPQDAPRSGCSHCGGSGVRCCEFGADRPIDPAPWAACQARVKAAPTSVFAIRHDPAGGWCTVEQRQRDPDLSDDLGPFWGPAVDLAKFPDREDARLWMLVRGAGIRDYLLAAGRAERDVSGHGKTKAVSAVDGRLVATQARRYDGTADFAWAVALTDDLAEDWHVFTPAAARRLAGELLAAANEVEQFDREDRQEVAA